MGWPLPHQSAAFDDFPLLLPSYLFHFYLFTHGLSSAATFTSFSAFSFEAFCWCWRVPLSQESAASRLPVRSLSITTQVEYVVQSHRFVNPMRQVIGSAPYPDWSQMKASIQSYPSAIPFA